MAGFILFFIVMMVRSIVGAYTLTPTSTAEDLRGLPLWQIPLAYLGLCPAWMGVPWFCIYHLRFVQRIHPPKLHDTIYEQ